MRPYIELNKLVKSIGGQAHNYKQYSNSCIVDLCCVGHAMEVVRRWNSLGYRVIARNRGRFVRIVWPF